MKKFSIFLMIIALGIIAVGCYMSTQPPEASPDVTTALPTAAPTLEPVRAAATSQPNNGMNNNNAGVSSSAGLELKSDKLKQDNPELKVYNISSKKLETMPLETYLEGVLAGEMPGDWPMEALKAQAILARTFVVKFIDEKTSQYEGADISTDIKEAQAYAADGINEQIKKAVAETEGMVIVSDGKLPYAWFYSHAGGKTATAKEGLEFEGDEPTYTQVIASNDSEDAPAEVRNWSAEFGEKSVIAACKEAGLSISSLKSTEVGQKGESGRALTLSINGESVSAPKFRLAIGSTEMKSTLLSEIAVKDGKLVMSGSGYGHGVGMSQWGAYGMAKSGKSAEEIVQYYFKDVSVQKLW